MLYIQQRLITWHEKNTVNWDKAGRVELLVSALLACLLFLFAPLLHADEEYSADYGREQVDSLNALGSGAFMVSQPQGGYYGLPRLKTDFSLQVSGMVVQAVVSQVFTNDSDQWIEGQYVFPLPSDSAVNGMTIRIGDRVIKGQIKEKSTARKIFLEARQQGKKASLIEQQRPNLFTNRVTNIAPGERIEVELKYIQTLRYSTGEFSLRIPMTLTPRYIPGEKVLDRLPPEESMSRIQGQGWAFNTEQVLDALEITPPQRAVATLEAYNRQVIPERSTNVATVSIDLTPGFELALLQSSFHDITSEKSADHYKVRTKKASIAMNRDFVLRWRPVVEQSPVAAFFNESLENGQAGDEHHGLLLVMPPQLLQAKQQAARELVLVIDTSGSMGGTSIKQAKYALLIALQRLTVNDYFNVIEFNATTHRLFSTSVIASDENIAVAKRYVNGLRANGGTEMHGALKAALESSAQGDYPVMDGNSGSTRVRQVVFITDGSVGNEEALFRYITENINKTRLFTVAIGAAPNGYFMKKAAQFGRGVYTSIGSVQEVNASMAALFEKIERPVLTDVNVTFHNGGVTEFYPAKIPDLYADEPLLLYVKLAEKTDTVTISGEYLGRYWQQDIVPSWSKEYRGVATLWGRQKIEYLMDEAVRHGNRDRFREDIVSLGMYYKIMSRYTSFVAVDLTPSRPMVEGLKQQNVANSMPAGSEQVAPSVAYPRTALGINGLILSGVLCLFLGLIMLCLKQDRHVLRIKYAIDQKGS